MFSYFNYRSHWLKKYSQYGKNILSSLYSNAEVLDFDDHNSVEDKRIDKFLNKENLENNYAQTLKEIQNHYFQQQQILQHGNGAEK